MIKQLSMVLALGLLVLGGTAHADFMFMAGLRGSAPDGTTSFTTTPLTAINLDLFFVQTTPNSAFEARSVNLSLLESGATPAVAGTPTPSGALWMPAPSGFGFGGGGSFGFANAGTLTFSNNQQVAPPNIVSAPVSSTVNALGWNYVKVGEFSVTPNQTANRLETVYNWNNNFGMGNPIFVTAPGQSTNLLDTAGSQAAFQRSMAFTVAAVPEPSTFGLAGVACLLVGAVRRRKQTV